MFGFNFGGCVSPYKQLSEDERYQLSLYIESATLAVLTAEAIPWRDIKSWTNLCGINPFPGAYK
jgi:hypothetical protein